MRRMGLFSVLALSVTAPAFAAIDGKVAGMNADTFTAFQNIKKRNPGALTQDNAEELKLAVLKDNKIDDAERDLLEEMTQSQFRSITVTLVNAKPTDTKVTTYPVSGNAKQVLKDVLNPPADLEKEWGNGSAGWNVIVREYKKSAVDEARVINFAIGKFAEQWVNSNMGNGYKPLRDEIAKRYGYSNSAGGDANTGRTIIYKSMNQVDRNAKDSVPDFLYNWVRPGGYLDS